METLYNCIISISCFNPFLHTTILQHTTLNIFFQNIENLYNCMDILWLKAKSCLLQSRQKVSIWGKGLIIFAHAIVNLPKFAYQNGRLSWREIIIVVEGTMYWEATYQAMGELLWRFKYSVGTMVFTWFT